MYFHTPFLHTEYYAVHSLPLSQYLSSILIASKVKYEIWLSPSWTRVEIEVQLHNSKITLDVICYSKGSAIRNSSSPGKPFLAVLDGKKKKKEEYGHLGAKPRCQPWSLGARDFKGVSAFKGEVNIFYKLKPQGREEGVWIGVGQEVKGI